MRSSAGFAAIEAMETFHTDGNCVENVWRAGDAARAVARDVMGPLAMGCGAGKAGKKGLRDMLGDMGVSSESLNAMFAVHWAGLTGGTETKLGRNVRGWARWRWRGRAS